MLSESYVIGPETPAVENKAIGQSLKQAADECPDRIGLIAGVSDIRDRREFTLRANVRRCIDCGTAPC